MLKHLCVHAPPRASLDIVFYVQTGISSMEDLGRLGYEEYAHYHDEKPARTPATCPLAVMITCLVKAVSGVQPDRADQR